VKEKNRDTTGAKLTRRDKEGRGKKEEERENKKKNRREKEKVIDYLFL
jgi:hypothetical protein